MLELNVQILIYLKRRQDVEQQLVFIKGPMPPVGMTTMLSYVGLV